MLKRPLHQDLCCWRLLFHMKKDWCIQDASSSTMPSAFTSSAWMSMGTPVQFHLATLNFAGPSALMKQTQGPHPSVFGGTFSTKSEYPSFLGPSHSPHCSPSYLSTILNEVAAAPAVSPCASASSAAAASTAAASGGCPFTSCIVFSRLPSFATFVRSSICSRASRTFCWSSGARAAAASASCSGVASATAADAPLPIAPLRGEAC
mmetsp:Transcript_112643/g.313303  ORF Transcript_112643/g.313303 Transcript_112643/m.313303 type:complete len:206 (-) Transcript_112643:57-674(-)